MYDDILGEYLPKCPDCLTQMIKHEDGYAICPNGCWEYHGDLTSEEGIWKVGLGS
jgi:hypothetical protein